MDASQTIINHANVFWVAITSLLFCVISFRGRLILGPFIFCVVMMATTVVPAWPAFLRAIQKAEGSSGIVEISHERNMFVVSFDGIPGVVARRVLEQEKELAGHFKDFVFFANAASQSPATRASIRSELYGNRNYHEIGETDDQVEALLDPASLLMNHVDNSFAYGNYRRHHLSPGNRVSPLHFAKAGKQEQIDQHLFWLDLLYARYGTPYLALAIRKTWLYEYIQQGISRSEPWQDQLSQRVNQYAGPEWKKILVRQIIDYTWIVEHLEASQAGLGVRYMHFAHTHFPVDFDENAAYRGHNRKWLQSNQNVQGLYNQCIGVMKQFVMFKEKLEELGVYDRSLIVFKSDHGEPAMYYDFHPHDLRINGHESWGVDRYMPLLMIKDFGRTNDRIEYNTNLVTLPDLAKTLCVAASVEGMDCTLFPGMDLLGEYNPQESPIFFAEVVANAGSTHKFSTHQTIRLERRHHTVYEALMANGQIQMRSQTE